MSEQAALLACDHPASARVRSLLYDIEEAFVCTACSSMVFADGHTEWVGISKMTTSKR